MKEKKRKHVLLLCGGGGSEHPISLKSAQYILGQLKRIPQIETSFLCLEGDGRFLNSQNQECELRKKALYNKEEEKETPLDYAIACIHGPPGENGKIQSLFEFMDLPYLGPGPEASLNCFNKITTKMWLNHLQIPNSPFIPLFQNDQSTLSQALDFLKERKDIFVKASHQGSSIGCYHVTSSKTEEELKNILTEAFSLSPYVLLEKTIKGRELEVSAFEYQGQIHISPPGEIKCPSQFYSYEEKYNQEGQTTTSLEAEGLSSSKKDQIKVMAKKAFEGLKLKDLSRIDFFLEESGKIYLNEINTFPGHTSISMFPAMMESMGISYVDFLKDRIL